MEENCTIIIFRLPVIKNLSDLLATKHSFLYHFGIFSSIYWLEVFLQTGDQEIMTKLQLRKEKDKRRESGAGGREKKKNEENKYFLYL